MSSLAAREKGFEEIGKRLAENFVFLNVYCTSVAAEHEPRGPEGPYQFTDTSVPVLVMKSWDGVTLAQKLGEVADLEVAKKNLERAIEKALKDNGPVLAPKLLRPLVKAFESAERHLAKAKPAAAWKDFEKVVEFGADEKKFPEGPPGVAQRAAAAIAEIFAAADRAIDEASRLEDPKKVRTAYRKLLATHGGIPAIKQKILAAIKELAAD